MAVVLYANDFTISAKGQELLDDWLYTAEITGGW
jgi:hypothetical protein